MITGIFLIWPPDIIGAELRALLKPHSIILLGNFSVSYATMSAIGFRGPEKLQLLVRLSLRIMLLFDDNMIKMARKPGKI